MLYHDGKWSFIQKHNGVALAMIEPELLEVEDDSPFLDETIHLEPGDMLFQYTDGVSEATNAASELFGDERLLDAMNRAETQDPEELLRHLRRVVLPIPYKSSGIATFRGNPLLFGAFWRYNAQEWDFCAHRRDER